MALLKRCCLLDDPLEINSTKSIEQKKHTIIEMPFTDFAKVSLFYILI